MVLLKLLVTVAPEQLSEVVGRATVTAAVHAPLSVSWVILAGQEMVGSSASLTVTSNEQVAVLPALSVAVKVTVVVPSE